MEYVVGPVLALLIGMKFTDYKVKKVRADLTAVVEEKIVDNTKQVSQQTLRMMMPMAKSVTDINKQLGL